MSGANIDIIFEHFDSRLDLLTELMQTMLDRQDAMDARLADHEATMQDHALWMRDHTLRLNNQEMRLQALEMPGRA